VSRLRQGAFVTLGDTQVAVDAIFLLHLRMIFRTVVSLLDAVVRTRIRTLQAGIAKFNIDLYGHGVTPKGTDLSIIVIGTLHHFNRNCQLPAQLLLQSLLPSTNITAIPPVSPKTSRPPISRTKYEKSMIGRPPHLPSLERFRVASAQKAPLYRILDASIYFVFDLPLIR
jgi:hypothetical protein